MRKNIKKKGTFREHLGILKRQIRSILFSVFVPASIYGHFCPLYVFSLMLWVGDGIKDLFVGGKIE